MHETVVGPRRSQWRTMLEPRVSVFICGAPAIAVTCRFCCGGVPSVESCLICFTESCTMAIGGISRVSSLTEPVMNFIHRRYVPVPCIERSPFIISSFSRPCVTVWIMVWVPDHGVRSSIRQRTTLSIPVRPRPPVYWKRSVRIWHETVVIILIIEVLVLTVSFRATIVIIVTPAASSHMHAIAIAIRSNFFIVFNFSAMVISTSSRMPFF